ncbi:MAG: hypothetical protein WCV72_03065 [Patescibacteria group bacterium]|jgi:hypothetical protein
MKKILIIVAIFVLIVFVLIFAVVSMRRAPPGASFAGENFDLNKTGETSILLD